MAGLEQYRGMTADEKLTALCVKMDNIEARLDSLPPCPSPRCGEHEARLTRVETILAVVGSAVIVLVPIIMWLFDKQLGGP
jgi:hypothetical protein